MYYLPNKQLMDHFDKFKSKRLNFHSHIFINVQGGCDKLLFSIYLVNIKNNYLQLLSNTTNIIIFYKK